MNFFEIMDAFAMGMVSKEDALDQLTDRGYQGDFDGFVYRGYNKRMEKVEWNSLNVPLTWPNVW